MYPNTQLLANLLKTNSHYGTPTKTLNIHHAPYLYGIRSKQAVINLHHTIQSIRHSFFLVAKILQKQKQKKKDHKILIVCNEVTTRFFKQQLQATPLANKMHYLSEEWVGGFITNPLLLPKKLQNIRLIVAFNGTRDHLLIHAAQMAKIPLISVVNTDVNPNWITYPIVMNTTNPGSIFFFMFLFKKYLNHLTV